MIFPLFRGHAAFLASWILSAGAASAVTYHVAPSGDDSASGTESAPWKTMGKASATVNPGDVVEVHGGTYAELVRYYRSGTAEAPIIFRNRAGETPVFDGGTITIGTGWQPMFWLHDVSHVRIEGFEIRNLGSALRGRVPIGILITGSGVGVQILNNHIHHLGTTYTGKSGGDAHGIAAYGDSADPMADLQIRGNRLHDLTLGSSEALVLNGNVSGFLIEENAVTDCNNIGIDAIGHEGTCPVPALDQARDGVIRLNTVRGISSYGNPAYGNHYSAGGIYVDGGRDILIERNTVEACDIGVELASEHAGQATSGIHVRNNLIFRNRIGGIFMGGYDTERGRTEGCRIEHNTLFENDSLQYDNGEIHLQFDVRNTTIRHNLIVANAQRLIVGNPYTQNTNNTLDHNLVHAQGTPRWQWKQVNSSGLAAWQSASGNDLHSLNVNPLLLDPAAGDFGLRPKSPAIDAGDVGFVPGIDEQDHAGAPRVRGARTDLGALEFDLEEFASGTGKTLSPSLDIIPPPGGQAHISYYRRLDWALHGLNFQIQTSTTLASNSWMTVDSSLISTSQRDEGQIERVVFSFSPPAGTRWFARVAIFVN